MAIKKKTPTSKSRPAAKAAPKRAAPKKATAKAAPKKTTAKAAPKKAAPKKTAAKAAPKKAAAKAAAPKRAAPKSAAAKSETTATGVTRTAGVKKTPAKKAAIRASSATVLKLAGKKLGERGSTTAKKPAAKKTKASEKSATGATKRAEGLVAKVKKARPPRETPERVNEESLALARRAASLAAEKKALDVVLIDVCGRTSYTDYLVVASAETERQVSAIAETIEVTLKGEGHRVLSSEGHTPGQWVLLDYGGAVIHLFTDEARPFYDLEGMWPDAKRESVV